jgi:hypothetical protein
VSSSEEVYNVTNVVNNTHSIYVAGCTCDSPDTSVDPMSSGARHRSDLQQWVA